MPSIIDIIVGLNHSAVDTGVEHIREQVAEMKSNFAQGIGEVASIGFIAEQGREVIEYGAKVKNLSEQFGISTEKLQELSNAASLHDVTMEEVGKAYNKLIINQQKAIEGNQTAKQAFDDLGISVKDLMSMAPDELFDRVSDSLKTARDRGEAYADVAELIGSRNTKLITTMEEGSEAIKKQGEAMGVLNDATIDSLDDANKHIKIFEQQVTVAFGTAISWATRLVSAVALYYTNVLAEADIVLNKIERNTARVKELTENLKKVNADTLQFIKTGIDPNAEPDKKPAIDEDREATDKAGDAAKKKALEKQIKDQETLWRIQESGAEHALKARIEAMTVEEKIAFFTQRIAMLQNAIDNDNDPEGKEKDIRLKYELEQQLAAAQKTEDERKAEAAKKLAEDTERYQKMLHEREKRLDDERFDTRFRALRTEGEKKAALMAREKQLEDDLAKIPKMMAQEVFDKLDEIEAIKSRIAEEDARKPAMAKADSLARIGGGGNVSSMAVANQQLNEAKEQTKLLRQIAGNGNGGITNLQ